MSFANPIVDAGLTGLTELYRSRAITPLEATEAYLARIERLNPQLGAYVTVDAAGARAAAEASAARWAAGSPLSPLDGAPVAVKANIAVAGLPWHAGIAAYRDRLAPEDAAVVGNLKAAGAVILGILNMHEAALGATTDNAAFGRCHNPHRHGFTAGGSSGGSGAAVAAGLCAAALGTDTMGSVRIPSGYCGVYAHKPTQGLIDTDQVVALSWTLDHVGVHARSIKDCAALLDQASGGLSGDMGDEAFVAAPRSALGQAPLAVLDFAGQVEVEPAVQAAFDATMARARAAGLTLETVRLDYDFGAMRRLGLLMSEAEGFVEHQAMLAADPEGFTPGLRKLLTWGAEQPAWKLAKAYRDLGEVAARISEVLSPYEAVLMPTAPQAAFAFETPAPANQADFTALADFLGLPATAFPVGMSPGGLPLSVQVMAWDDDVALGLAALLADPVAAPPAFRG